MIKELFSHACIVIALLFLGGAFFRNLHSQSPSRRIKILFGISAGILGSILMYFSIQIPNVNILLDLRHIAVMIAVLYGGNVSVLVATLIIGVSRFVFFPIGYSANVATITLIAVTLLVITINHLKVSQIKKAILMIVFSTSLYSVMYYSILSYFKLNPESIVKIVIAYTIASVVGSVLTYYLVDYITTSNSSYLELQRQAQFDFLTGLKNVRQYSRLLEAAQLNSKQKKEPLALMFLDIDHFKYINDTFGHHAGDEVLRELGRILSQNIRPGDHAFRNGGEEFSILMPNTSETQAFELAEIIRRKVEQHPFYLPNGTDRYITISIGIAVNSGDSRIFEIANDADKALYDAKNSGRNKVCITKRRAG